MNVILLNNFCKRKGSIDLCLPKSMMLFVLLAFALIGVSVFAGYSVGMSQIADASDSIPQTELKKILDEDRAALQEEKARLQANLDALSIKIGSLQAKVLRLDSLGERLVDVAKLDGSEFNFSEEPALGGLEIPESSRSQTVSSLTDDIEAFNRLLQDRTAKLDILDELIHTGQLYEETTPSGRPITKGWLSSRFGKRIDPKTGKKTFHRGYDYAGKTGDEVIAVASGIVTRAERQKGFGNMIEIKHVEGYSTLYAHNKKNLVAVGDVVKKGQQIAMLGSTGRSTGPHVHFEVRKDGKYVNPTKYIKK
jgi:murein DD-endopeptidase MepM/ murein hydrolase activator NlpD